MGSPRSFVCKTCCKDYYLGYGSSSSWMTERYILSPEHLKGTIQTAAQYDEWHDKSEKLNGANLNFRQCLVQHEGHDWFVRDDENDDVHNENPKELWACYATGIEDFREKLCDDWDKYEHIDMAKEAIEEG